MTVGATTYVVFLNNIDDSRQMLRQKSADKDLSHVSFEEDPHLIVLLSYLRPRESVYHWIYGVYDFYVKKGNILNI
jgi:hypothetical protein